MERMPDLLARRNAAFAAGKCEMGQLGLFSLSPTLDMLEF